MSLLKQTLFILFISICSPLYAEQYQSNADFLSQTFNNNVPKPRLLWMSGRLKIKSERILQHKIGFLRTRYWRNKTQSVWILNEIGKTKAITIAVVIKDEKIAQLNVLEFRESRGWEVKHDFFTKQFKQKHLTEDLQLSEPIDGISGATLSVRALTKVAQLALLFNQFSTQ